MRGRRRKHVIAQTRIPGEITHARERVERAWFGRMERDEALATQTIARDNRREPFHRWVVLKQAFSPALVRRFLRDAVGSDVTRAPLLDPFSGTGTFVAECARRGVAAVGVEPLMSLAFVTRMKWARACADDAELRTTLGREELIASEPTTPIHRAALICAVAARMTAKGTINRNASPLSDNVRERLAMMRDDLRSRHDGRLRSNMVVRADARDLSCLADESIGGILTSPPYLSRHDYSKIARPLEVIYDRFSRLSAPCETPRNPEPDQLPASPRARTGAPPRATVHEAASEACDALERIDQRKLAAVVRAYFQDLSRVLRSCHRVLQPGRPCWIVVGGARLKDVYIPTDTILADCARSIGFVVEKVIVARAVVPGGRRFGRLTRVSPRESLLVMRRA